jgi:LysM repeat protein
MASEHELPNSKLSMSTPRTTQPPYSRYNSGRSSLRSAEEQLRDIKEGDTSWQRAHTTLAHESPSSYPSSPSNTGDVLERGDHIRAGSVVRVYLHIVRKTDTLPLILLTYHISANALKKANRLWATDSIQSRQKLYLPVEECAITPVSSIQPPDLKDSQNKTCVPESSGRIKAHGDDNERPSRLSDQDLQLGDDGVEDRSEEWVKIPGVGPVQVISLPAYKLSYFPTQGRNAMERSASLPTFDSLVAEERITRDSMDSIASRSSVGSLVEDGVGRIIRFWHENQGRKKWAKIGQDLIEL